MQNKQKSSTRTRHKEGNTASVCMCVLDDNSDTHLGTKDAAAGHAVGKILFQEQVEPNENKCDQVVP